MYRVQVTQGTYSGVVFTRLREWGLPLLGEPFARRFFVLLGKEAEQLEIARSVV